MKPNPKSQFLYEKELPESEVTRLRAIAVGQILALERDGHEPNKKMKKHVLKGRVEDIPFTTPEWQTWVCACRIDVSICG